MGWINAPYEYFCPIGMGGIEISNELKQQTMGRMNAPLKYIWDGSMPHMSSINGKDECPIEIYGME